MTYGVSHGIIWEGTLYIVQYNHRGYKVNPNCSCPSLLVSMYSSFPDSSQSHFVPSVLFGKWLILVSTTEYSKNSKLSLKTLADRWKSEDPPVAVMSEELKGNLLKNVEKVGKTKMISNHSNWANNPQ